MNPAASASLHLKKERNRTVHALSGGGELVDTPGLREFGLVEILAVELAIHFPGFEEHGEARSKGWKN